MTTSNLTYFEAAFESNLNLFDALQGVESIKGIEAVSYRWDFGDGTTYVGPFANNVVAHSYVTCGSHTVRVEVVDSLGNVAIGTLEVDVSVCSGTVLYLPLVLPLKTVDILQ